MSGIHENDTYCQLPLACSPLLPVARAAAQQRCARPHSGPDLASRTCFIRCVVIFVLLPRHEFCPGNVMNITTSSINYVSTYVMYVLRGHAAFSVSCTHCLLLDTIMCGATHFLCFLHCVNTTWFVVLATLKRFACPLAFRGSLRGPQESNTHVWTDAAASET